MYKGERDYVNVSASTLIVINNRYCVHRPIELSYRGTFLV